MPRSLNVLALVGFVAGFVPEGPVLVPRSSKVLAPVGFVADLTPPGFVPDAPVSVLRSSKVLASVGFVPVVPDLAPLGFVPDGPVLLTPRSSSVLAPVGFVADLAPPGFVPDGPVPVPRSSSVLAPVGFVADLAPPGFVPDGPVPVPRSSNVLAPVGFVPPGFFAPALGSTVVDVSRAATTPLPANSPGLAVAAIAGLPWFSEASSALFSLAVCSCWSCEGTAATCCSWAAACSSCVGRTVVPPDPPLKLTLVAPGSTITVFSYTWVIVTLPKLLTVRL